MFPLNPRSTIEGTYSTHVVTLREGHSKQRRSHHLLQLNVTLDSGTLTALHTGVAVCEKKPSTALHKEPNLLTNHAHEKDLVYVKHRLFIHIHILCIHIHKLICRRRTLSNPTVLSPSCPLGTVFPQAYTTLTWQSSVSRSCSTLYDLRPPVRVCISSFVVAATISVGTCVLGRSYRKKMHILYKNTITPAMIREEYFTTDPNELHMNESGLGTIQWVFAHIWYRTVFPTKSMSSVHTSDCTAPIDKQQHSTWMPRPTYHRRRCTCHPYWKELGCSASDQDFFTQKPHRTGDENDLQRCPSKTRGPQEQGSTDMYTIVSPDMLKDRKNLSLNQRWLQDPESGNPSRTRFKQDRLRFPSRGFPGKHRGRAVLDLVPFILAGQLLYHIYGSMGVAVVLTRAGVSICGARDLQHVYVQSLHKLWTFTPHRN